MSHDETTPRCAQAHERRSAGTELAYGEQLHDVEQMLPGEAPFPRIGVHIVEVRVHLLLRG